jgi:hypothetical protein
MRHGSQEDVEQNPEDGKTQAFHRKYPPPASTRLQSKKVQLPNCSTGLASFTGSAKHGGK